MCYVGPLPRVVEAREYQENLTKPCWGEFQSIGHYNVTYTPSNAVNNPRQLWQGVELPLEITKPRGVGKEVSPAFHISQFRA